MQVGGISLHLGRRLGDNLMLADLRRDYDAVFLSIGLAGVNAITISGDAREGIENAVDWIANLRQSQTKADVAVGRNVIVIGGGMTAVDAAVQAKLLGAEAVTIAYRRDKSSMGASAFEQDLATSKGVHILYNAAPKSVGADSITLARTKTENGKLVETGETVTLAADHILHAIGQTLSGAPDIVALDGGKIAVTGPGRTSVKGIWAGGDCASGGQDLTVTAVAEGRDAAEDIHASLSKGS